MGGTIRDQWDVVKALQQTETNDTFWLAIADFCAKFLKDTDVMKQKLYIDTQFKRKEFFEPFKQVCPVEVNHQE